MTTSAFITYTDGILAIALAFSVTAAPVSARSFDFNSAGSMVQQPLPPQCVRYTASAE
jgi:hypothetical protein